MAPHASPPHRDRRQEEGQELLQWSLTDSMTTCSSFCLSISPLWFSLYISSCLCSLYIWHVQWSVWHFTFRNPLRSSSLSPCHSLVCDSLMSLSMIERNMIISRSHKSTPLSQTTSRFLPHVAIETEAVLSLDEDTILLTSEVRVLCSTYKDH